MGEGWISVYRKIQDSWLWEDKPFSKGQAWIDLLLLANHKDKKTLVGDCVVNVKRGSYLTSQRKLMKRWGWGNTKVRNFLELLKEDKMVSFVGKDYTEITILNYEMYQTTNKQDIPTDSGKAQIVSKSGGKQKTNHPQEKNKPPLSQTYQELSDTSKPPTNQQQTANKSQTNTNNKVNKYNTVIIEKENKEKESWVIALKYFCEKSGKLDTQLRTRELEAAQKICAEVPSLDIVLKGIDKAFDDFKPDTGSDKINSFKYCVPIIKKINAGLQNENSKKIRGEEYESAGKNTESSPYDFSEFGG